MKDLESFKSSMTIDFNLYARHQHRVDIMFRLGVISVRHGKRVIFKFDNVKDGLQKLRHEFPTALFVIYPQGVVQVRLTKGK